MSNRILRAPWSFWVALVLLSAALLVVLSAQEPPDSSPEYLATLTVHREGSIDLGRDTSFFYLTVGSGTDAATRFTIAGDADLRVMRWLEAHNNERISLRLGAYDPLRRDGEQ